MVCDILCTKGEKIYMYLIEYIGERRKENTGKICQKLVRMDGNIYHNYPESLKVKTCSIHIKKKKINKKGVNTKSFK